MLLRGKKKKVAVYSCDIPIASECLGFSVMFDKFHDAVCGEETMVSWW